jgi:hypothetical protein
MEEIGPVEYMIVSFPGNRFTGEIAPALGKLVESNTIRIIDLAFVGKDEDGSVAAFELSDVDEDVRRGLDALGLEATGLLGEEDLMDAAADLEPGSSAAMLLWEDIWAAELASALRGAGGELVAIGRIPHDVVMEAREACCPPPPPHRRVEMFRRRGGLVRAAATTAVVAGTAGAVRHRQDQKYAAQDQEAYDQQMAAQQAAAAQAGSGAAGLHRRARAARPAEGTGASSPTRSSRRRRSRSSESDARATTTRKESECSHPTIRSWTSSDDVHLLPVHHLDLDPHHGLRGHLPAQGHIGIRESRMDRLRDPLAVPRRVDLPHRQPRRHGGQEPGTDAATESRARRLHTVWSRAEPRARSRRPKGLIDSGAITQAEFDSIKAKALASS